MTRAELQPFTLEPVRLEVGSEIFVEVQPVPAAAWVRAISGPYSAWLLSPGLLDQEDREVVLLNLASGILSAKDVQDATFSFLEEACGRKWYSAARLAGASTRADILGELTLHGVDPHRVHLGPWVAAAYRILTRNLDAKGVLKVDSQLEVPPAGWEDDWDSIDGFGDMVAKARSMTSTD